VAEEREKVLGDLSREKDTIQARTAALLKDATEQHAALTSAIAEDTERSQRLRAQSMAEAERTKVLATREGQQLVRKAQQEAERAHQLIAERWAERQAKLRREIDMLTQRKHAILAQLSNLSTLAGNSLEEFPDMEFGALDKLSREPEIAALPEGPEDEPPADEQAAEEATVVIDRDQAERLAADTPTQIKPLPQPSADATDSDEASTQDRPSADRPDRSPVPVPPTADVPFDAENAAADPQQDGGRQPAARDQTPR